MFALGRANKISSCLRRNSLMASALYYAYRFCARCFPPLARVFATTDSSAFPHKQEPNTFEDKIVVGNFEATRWLHFPWFKEANSS